MNYLIAKKSPCGIKRRITVTDIWFHYKTAGLKFNYNTSLQKYYIPGNKDAVTNKEEVEKCPLRLEFT